jgi:hypothetical protein
MTLITPDDRISRTADLLRSLEESLGNLRRQAEDLRRQIETGEEADLVNGSKQVAQVNSLIRSCQKVEENFVEHHNRQAGIAQGGYALDLEQARSEIGCRLARLRAC